MDQHDDAPRARRFPLAMYDDVGLIAWRVQPRRDAGCRSRQSVRLQRQDYVHVDDVLPDVDDAAFIGAGARSGRRCHVFGGGQAPPRADPAVGYLDVILGRWSRTVANRRWLVRVRQALLGLVGRMAVTVSVEAVAEPAINDSIRVGPDERAADGLAIPRVHCCNPWCVACLQRTGCRPAALSRLPLNGRAESGDVAVDDVAFASTAALVDRRLPLGAVRHPATVTCRSGSFGLILSHRICPAVRWLWQPWRWWALLGGAGCIVLARECRHRCAGVAPEQAERRRGCGRDSERPTCGATGHGRHSLGGHMCGRSPAPRGRRGSPWTRRLDMARGSVHVPNRRTGSLLRGAARAAG
jgi:hypothetical protein